MASTEARVSMATLMSDLSMQVTITGQRRWAMRQWLGVRLIKLAAWVMGLGIEVETHG